MVVDSVNMLDGNVYLVSQGDNIKPAGATDFDNVINNISSGSESLDDIFNEVSNEYGVNVNLLKAKQYHIVGHRGLCSLCRQRQNR